jgi:hypothetical protein
VQVRLDTDYCMTFHKESVMKFEQAIAMMLRGGCTIRREGWVYGKCMFVDINPMRHTSYLIRAYGEWENTSCSLVSEDFLAEDWACCECPKTEQYPTSVKPATVCVS